MARMVDLIGKRYGLLTVVERTEKRENGYCLWRCRCDCGGEILVSTRKLKNGTVTNCGCITKDSARRGRLAEDLTGRHFGRLTVIRRIENKHNRTCWLCQCDCGNQCEATAHMLKSGKVKSCGCIRGGPIYDITGLRFGKLTAIEPTERRDRKGSVYWRCRCDCGNETEAAEGSLMCGKVKSCGCLKREIQSRLPNRLHRVDGTCVEFLDKRKYRSDNTSGFRGVFRNKNGRFRVSIGFKKQRFYLGTYKSYEEAVAVRLRAEEQIHQAFVESYHIWEEQCMSSPEQVPFIFDVEKTDGEFKVKTNINTQ